MGLQNHHNNFNALRLLGALFVFITHSFAVTGSQSVQGAQHKGAGEDHGQKSLAFQQLP